MSKKKFKGISPKYINGDFAAKILSSNRTSTTVEGGRKWAFQSIATIGNDNGFFAVATGKGNDSLKARKNAITQAKKKIVHIDIEDGTIRHKVYGKYSNAYVVLMPRKNGGIIADNNIKTILTSAGIANISIKVIKSGNSKLNVYRAIIVAIKKIKHAKFRSI